MKELDRLWAQVNALGGTAPEGDEYARGIVETVGRVLDMIEELGGQDPLAAEVERDMHNAIQMGRTMQLIENVMFGSRK